MDAKTAMLIEKLRQNQGLAQQIMRSGDGQNLLNLLTRQDSGAALERAAQAAAQGNPQLLTDLMQTKDGAAVMSRLNEQAKQ